MQDPDRNELEHSTTPDAQVPEEITQRTVHGVTVWMRGALWLLWGAIFAMLFGTAIESNIILSVAPFLLAIAFAVTPLTYFFVILEPAAFAARGVQRLIALSFGTFVLLSLLVLILRAVLPSGTLATPQLTILLALTGVLVLAASVAMLIHALRTNRRFRFLAAFLLLLLANLVHFTPR